MEIPTLRVSPRGYELDADARLPPGGWARYLEHARWTCLAAITEALGEAPFVRGVLRAQRWRWSGSAVTLGDALVVDSRISRVGRTSFDFAHRVRDASGGLRAETDATVVRLSDEGGPAPLPEALRALAGAPSDLSIPGWEAAGPHAPSHALTRIVQASDLDLNRHLNQARYVDWLHDVLVDGAATLGVAGRALRALHLEHLAECRRGTAVTVAAAVEGGRRVAATVTREDGVLAARASAEL